MQFLKEAGIFFLVLVPSIFLFKIYFGSTQLNHNKLDTIKISTNLITNPTANPTSITFNDDSVEEEHGDLESIFQQRKKRVDDYCSSHDDIDIENYHDTMSLLIDDNANILYCAYV